MQSSSQPASPSASQQPPSFAGFLSALASPSPLKSAWNDDALADDVTTLSYESALKAHSRYKPEPEPPAQLSSLPAQPSSPFVTELDSPASGSLFSTAAREPQPPATGLGDPKSASITIRMSQAECTQLKQRAAQAGMTISAYLRSCTVEAETLRGQVKQALSQLRAAASADKKPAAPSVQTPKKRDWLSRILPRGRVRSPRVVN
jgi:hypothetical protein